MAVELNQPLGTASAPVSMRVSPGPAAEPALGTQKQARPPEAPANPAVSPMQEAAKALLASQQQKLPGQESAAA